MCARAHLCLCASPFLIAFFLSFFLYLTFFFLSLFLFFYNYFGAGSSSLLFLVLGELFPKRNLKLLKHNFDDGRSSEPHLRIPHWATARLGDLQRRRKPRMGCAQSTGMSMGSVPLALVPQNPPQQSAWQSLVVKDDSWCFKLQPSAVSATFSSIRDGLGNDVALVQTVDNVHKGTVVWTIMDTTKDPKFKITEGNTSGTYFITDINWGGIIATIQKKYSNSDSEIEVYADDKVGVDDALMYTCLGLTHNINIVNYDGETIARARKGTRFVDVAKGVDAIYVICLYLVRDKLEEISETFH